MVDFVLKVENFLFIHQSHIWFTLVILWTIVFDGGYTGQVFCRFLGKINLDCIYPWHLSLLKPLSIQCLLLCQLRLLHLFMHFSQSIDSLLDKVLLPGGLLARVDQLSYYHNHVDEHVQRDRNLQRPAHQESLVKFEPLSETEQVVAC